jgi:3-oxoadipate enol-lactonase
MMKLQGGNMMRIKANGIQMNYELSGKRNASVVMMSHSLGSSLTMWEPQLDTLEPSFQVLRYDTRGHGRTEAAKGPYTMELLAEDAVGLLDALGIDKVHWVGLSMGGMIGQCLALNHFDHLLSLALCDTSAAVPSEAQPLWQERINLVREKGLQPLLEPTMDRWFTPAFLKRNSQRLELIRKEFLSTPVEGYIGCIEAIRRVNYMDRLIKIESPTLIVVGEDDPGAPVSIAEAMHTRIKDSTLVVIPSARHLSNIEQPEAFNSALMKFLTQGE